MARKNIVPPLQPTPGGWVCEECGRQLAHDDPNMPGPNTNACFGLLCEACEIDADYDDEDDEDDE